MRQAGDRVSGSVDNNYFSLAKVRFQANMHYSIINRYEHTTSCFPGRASARREGNGTPLVCRVRAME